MMEMLRERLKNPIVAAVSGFVLGLIIGLPILGWWLWPVRWINAEPRHLRPDLKTDYLCMVIDSYVKNQNQVNARARFELLGEEGEALLAALKPGQCNLSESDINQFRAALQGPVLPLPAVTPGTEQPAAAPRSSGVGLVIVLCLVTLAVGGVLVYLLVFRRQRGGPTTPSVVSQAREYSRQAEPTDYAAQGQQPPISQFMTTYVLGDDLYDDSFSIDSPAGEFLGECGVGISDTIGVGEPKRVTALEVWLFDKNDYQTVTKVLMTPHAYNDPAIRQRLESKGELIQVEPGQRITLEANTLVMEAHVADLVLGSGALQPDSYFERITIELSVWQKQA